MSKIVKVFDLIVDKKANGVESAKATESVKLIVNSGIPIKRFRDGAPDDPAILAKLVNIAKELNVDLRGVV